MSESTSDFLGTERFRVRRRLGSGGMGVVYEAHDRDTDKVLALKREMPGLVVLPAHDPTAARRLIES